MRYSLLLAGVFCLPAALFGQMRELSFYEVRPKQGTIVLDGKLDDAAWQNIPVHQNYYEYFKPNPKPGPLKTEFRMVYDEHGLYMGVINYDDHIDQLKRVITEFDNENLWMDDCGEFYVDPQADGIAFTKFTINPNGAASDLRRIDTAVYMNDWSGTGWTTVVTVNKDSWVIEAFFPWEDLNGKAESGSIWQFCHARYSWYNGFKGAVSSPEGNYDATDKFGYLYFSDGNGTLSPQDIGNILMKKAAAPWCIPCGNLLVSSRDGKMLKTDDLSFLIAEEKEKYRYLRMELEALNDPDSLKKADAVKKTLDSDVKFGAMPAYRAYQSANDTLFLLKWNVFVKQNFK